MEKMISFKRLEVTGATKEEALANAPFGIQGDATQMYRNTRKKHTGIWTDADMKNFMLDYLKNKSKNLPGVGFYITVESAVADTRERPYTVNDFKNKGTRHWETVLQIYENVGTAEKPVKGELITEVAGRTKAEAKAKAKELYTKNKLTKNIVCIPTKQVTDGEPISFTMTYTPSKSSRIGHYIVFGIENN